MAEDYRVDIALTKSEVIRYNFYHIRWLIILDIIGLGIFLYIVFGSYYHPDPETRQLLRTVSIWAAIALAVGLSQPLIILLQVYLSGAGKSESLVGRRNYSFSDAGIRIASDDKTAWKEWEDIMRVKNTGNILLIFTSPKLAYVIPRRCFKSKYEWRKFIKYILEQTKMKKKPGSF